MRPFLAAFVRHPVSLVGTGIATAMAVLFLVLLLLQSSGYVTNPYLGLLVFVAVPTVFVVGLALVPVGMWLRARRRRRRPSAPEADWPVFDFRIARQRVVGVTVIVLTMVNLVIVSVAAYGGVHYMETSAFCGQVCHTTMEPQFVAHRTGPHARVACAACHVGSGAGAFVEAKFAGVRQLWHVVSVQVPRPVPTPTGLLRTAADTCEQCHWPEKFHGDKVRVIREYASDEQNTETLTTLTLHVGGGNAARRVGAGIHWHMNIENRVEYVSAGSNDQEIPYVRVTDGEGRVREFVKDGVSAADFAAKPRHVMDCMDCHNRPAHTFSATADRGVNQAMAEGRIPRDLPFVKREATAAVSRTYRDRADALASIAKSLGEFYRPTGADAALVGRAIAGTQDVWSRNVFPAMRVTFGVYPNNIGHVDAPGCFRCHDDSHKTKDGRVLGQDCELCHAMPS